MLGGSIAVLVLLPTVGLAQRASVGVVAGGYFNSDFESRNLPGPPGFFPEIVVSDAGGYAIGPALSLQLTPDFMLEVEALYKPLHYEDGVRFRDDGVVTGFAPNTVVTWQFPVLAKYQFRQGKLRPFLEAGPSFRATGNLNSADPSHFGASAGIGFTANLRRIQISPGVRYTRWLEDGPGTDVRSKQDQVEFLIGFKYIPRLSIQPLGKRISLGMVAGATVSNDIRPEVSLADDGSMFRIIPAPPAVVIAPSIEVAIHDRLSLEFNAIPRSFRSRSELMLADGTLLRGEQGNSGGTWEFPVLGKFRLRQQGPRPFLAVGPSFRLPKHNLPVYGATIGAGVELLVKELKIAPTVRYTRWTHERAIVPGGPIIDSGVRRDQIRLLIGISF